MTICTFAGHRFVYHSELFSLIKSTIWNLLETGDNLCFYSGGMGEFDHLCENAVLEAKSVYPTTKLVLVLPYMTKELNTHKDYYTSRYDEIIIPDLSATHYKAAIQARNRWLVDQADILLSYVFRDFGGAFQTEKYAILSKKQVIQLHKNSRPSD